MPDNLKRSHDTPLTPTPVKQDSGLSQEGITAMQGPADQSEMPVPPQPEPPPEFTPKRAVGEASLAEMVESGPEKKEKEIFYGIGRGPERGG